MSPRADEQEIRRILAGLWPYADDAWIDVAVERIVALLSEET